LRFFAFAIFAFHCFSRAFGYFRHAASMAFFTLLTFYWCRYCLLSSAD
jgi:hypothetical protein